MIHFPLAPKRQIRTDLSIHSGKLHSVKLNIIHKPFKIFFPNNPLFCSFLLQPFSLFNQNRSVSYYFLYPVILQEISKGLLSVYKAAPLKYFFKLDLSESSNGFSAAIPSYAPQSRQSSLYVKSTTASTECK